MSRIDWVKWNAYGEKALHLFEDLSQPRWTAFAHCALADSVANPGPRMDLPRATDLYHKAQSLLVGFQEDFAAKIAANADYGIAQAANWGMRTIEGLPASRRAMDTAQRLGEQGLFLRSAIMHAGHLFWSGQIPDAFALVGQVWETADGLKDRPTIAHGATWGAASYHDEMHEYRQSRMWYERELSRPRTSSPYWRALLGALLGQQLIFTGNVKEALPLLAQAPFGFAEKGNALLLFWRGQWAEAESLWERFRHPRRENGERYYNRDLTSWTLRLQGRHEAEIRLLLDALAVFEKEPLQFYEMWMHPELSIAYVEIGRAEEALPHLARGREIVPPGKNGIAGLLLTAEATAEGALCYPRDVRASLATSERFQRAQERFSQAVEIFRDCQSRLDEAEAFYQWGRALIAAGRDAEGAEKLGAAVELYRSYGAGQPWIDRALAAKRDRSAVTIGTALDAAEERAVFRCEGDYWTISFGGEACRLKDARGLCCIAYLLRNPGVEISVIDLAQIGEATGASLIGEPGTPTRRDLGDAGPMLDAAAKADYRQRLEELREELEEAERLNDLGRAQVLRAELKSVTAELSAAVGKGGRDRKAASHIERARSMVSKRIKISMHRIRRANPALASHLAEYFRTGYYCAYLPDRPVHWQF